MIHNFQRTLGKSGIRVSAMGMGCWAIGGPFSGFGGMPIGWGNVNDKESLESLQFAFDNGINFYDTADVYGIGHSEELLAKAFRGKRDQVIIATKFGGVYDEKIKEMVDQDGSPQYMKKALENSLRRLNTDYIDIYQLHVKDWDLDKAIETREALESLVTEGKIRGYGWSTDDYERALLFSEGPNCAVVQHQLNIFVGNEEILTLCSEKDLASINRGPLAMGLLSGKFDKEQAISTNDVRTIMDAMQDPYYMYFREGKPIQELLDKLNAVREILKSGGRTLVQGALSWIWAKSEKTIPIPGFKTVNQVKENIKALDFGPLTREQTAEIDELIHHQDGMA